MLNPDFNPFYQSYNNNVYISVNKFYGNFYISDLCIDSAEPMKIIYNNNEIKIYCKENSKSEDYKDWKVRHIYINKDSNLNGK